MGRFNPIDKKVHSYKKTAVAIYRAKHKLLQVVSPKMRPLLKWRYKLSQHLEGD